MVEASAGKLVKVILETCLLNEAQIARGCALSEESGARFVKTSTGFAESGAAEAHVRLMRRAVGTRLGVKASGGIKEHTAAMRMILAGANRIGASASVGIVEGYRRSLEGP